VERTGYPLAYLLLENNGNCKNGIRTSIIQAFFAQMCDMGIAPNFLLTDKNFSQITNGQFLTAMEIYEFAIQEAYEFCKKNSLVALWCYLWSEWYNNKRWSLWAQLACTNKIPILKTTMFVEGHWKFPICKHLIQQKEVVLPDFFEKVQRNHQLPFLYENGQDLIQNDISNLNTYSNDLTNANQPDSELEHDCNAIYNQLIISTKKAFELLEQQKIAGNFRWGQSVAKNFNPIIKMVNDIESYKKRR
ncbi:7057_t:CDS:2, partial [Gigaspora margarita]